jgi:hypothetical protein
MELLEILLIVVGYLKDLQGEQKGKFVHLEPIPKMDRHIA